MFSYPDVNLGIYANQPNFLGKCMVTYYEEGNPNVYIVDIEQCFDVNLYEEKLVYLDAFPSVGEVFAVDLGNDGLHRAVHNENDAIFLIDSGEVLENASTADLKLFSLSKRAQNMSAKAIPCNVYQALDEHGKKINNLTEILFDEMYFTVLQIKDGKSVVKLYKSNKIVENERLQFTQEEVDILYEEPEMMTTNALKAVLSFVPQDEKRNCPFYDTRTGRCFKGNSCQLEHVAPLENGLTRDRKESKSKLPSSCVPMVGNTVKISITCIINADEFYAHIPEISAQNQSGSLLEFQNKLNCPEMVKFYKQYNGIPEFQELILVLHNGLFYRGKILDLYENQSSILFIDYGSTALIHQKNIYFWHPRWDTIPVQVHQCFLANIQLNHKSAEETKKAGEEFRNLILDSSELSVEIVSNAEDLFVLLYDEKGFDIGETLCAKGLAILKSKYIPVSTHYPA